MFDLKKYNQLTTLVILNILYLEQLMNDSHDEGPFYVAYSHHLRDFKNHSELEYDLPLIYIFEERKKEFKMRFQTDFFLCLTKNIRT